MFFLVYIAICFYCYLDFYFLSSNYIFALTDVDFNYALVVFLLIQKQQVPYSKIVFRIQIVLDINNSVHGSWTPFCSIPIPHYIYDTSIITYFHTNGNRFPWLKWTFSPWQSAFSIIDWNCGCITVWLIVVREASIIFVVGGTYLWYYYSPAA